MKHVENRVEAWVRDSLRDFHVRQMTHVHVDTLTGLENATAAQWLEAITVAYVHALEVLADRTRDIKTVLVIPLRDRDRLECEPVRRDVLENEMSDEPPSIYLIQREMDKRLRAGELYRCLLSDFGLFERTPADVFVFFEVWRPETERLNGWEYARTVFAEHYPREQQG